MAAISLAGRQELSSMACKILFIHSLWPISGYGIFEVWALVIFKFVKY
jgi:hypothetical protein